MRLIKRFKYDIKILSFIAYGGNINHEHFSDERNQLIA